ncbi:MAG: flagellar brake protein [Methylophilaceae bacterium]|nr:flagellar brake protein [Methylophilaceae bacterium]
MTEPEPSPAAGAHSLRTYRFDELRLQIDHRLQIEPASARAGEYFYTKLIGYLKGSSLIIRLPTSWKGTVPLGEGDTVTVRGFSGRIAYVFASEVLKIRYAPYPYCHLRFPQLIQGKEIRKAVRVSVNIPARVTNLRNGPDIGLEATISNLSVQGVQLDSTLPLGELGDTITVAFRFWIQPNDYEVNFNAAGVIQNIHQDEEANGILHYGIRFQNVRTTESLLLQHFIYENMSGLPLLFAR